MISVQIPPMIRVTKMRVWMRPCRVGVMGACSSLGAHGSGSSEAGVPGPLEPVAGGGDRAEALHEPEAGQVVADLERHVLQPEEGVDRRVVGAEGDGAR